MALFYNKKLFDSLGLKPPTTWAEYRAAGEKIHASDPKRFISSPYLDYDYAGPRLAGGRRLVRRRQGLLEGQHGSPRRTRRSPTTGRASPTTA